mmetsp:Transcript_71605/g.99479  ORF Transcript_71605/g.99479 Transcript_71605/m.99479 type:complete len:208 (-) Transcript_71605:6-629(-)
MECILESNKLFSRCTLREVKLPRKLDCCLVCLCTGVAEEGLVGEGNLHQGFSQPHLVFVQIKVRGMAELRGILGDHLGPALVAMTKAVDGDPRREVQVLFSFRVLEDVALTGHECQLPLPIVVQEVLLGGFTELCGGCSGSCNNLRSATDCCQTKHCGEGRFAGRWAAGVRLGAPASSWSSVRHSARRVNPRSRGRQSHRVSWEIRV